MSDGFAFKNKKESGQRLSCRALRGSLFHYSHLLRFEPLQTCCRFHFPNLSKAVPIQHMHIESNWARVRRPCTVFCIQCRDLANNRRCHSLLRYNEMVFKLKHNKTASNSNHNNKGK